MKFNEKLIKLRKEKGLSQEELGYKLNVTRQTVSKWELGQTTPEMDKLLELSKMFGISVDELLDNTKEIESQTGKNKANKSRKKTIIIVISVALVIFILLGILGMKIAKNLFNNVQDKSKEGTEMVLDVYETGLNLINQTQEEAEREQEEKVNQFNQLSDQLNKEFEQQVEKAKDEQSEKAEQMQEEYNQGLEKANQLMQQIMQ